MTTNEQFGIYADKYPCKLLGWTCGTLNAYAYPGVCSTDAWQVTSLCGSVSIRVAASVAGARVQCGGLPEFYYD